MLVTCKYTGTGGAIYFSESEDHVNKPSDRSVVDGWNFGTDQIG